MVFNQTVFVGECFLTLLWSFFKWGKWKYQLGLFFDICGKQCIIEEREGGKIVTWRTIFTSIQVSAYQS